MNQKIIFSSEVADLIEQPKPSLLTIPEAYKKMTKKAPNKLPNDLTVKACMPFLDALTSGYIITFPIDMCIYLQDKTDEKGETKTFFTWNKNENFPAKFENLIDIQLHTSDQISDDLRSSYRTIDVIFKILNPWHIKTPPGYSCIFTQPFNRNLPFKIIDGIVDTDVFEYRINFPAFWTIPLTQKEYLIKKGTPLAMVIPFKRESWKMKIEKRETETPEMYLKRSNIFIDWYKKLRWQKKSYK
tara:strand:- start:856 stop:1584 length:729 start_codon:yes stop_codon:yes gene_type:complete